MLKAPWSSFGSKVDGAMSAREACELGGLNWRVLAEPLYMERNQLIPGWVANRRSDVSGPNGVLGVVGASYEIIQNAEMFGLADALAGEGGAKYDTAGTFWGGAKVWMLMKMPQHFKVGGTDAVDKYVLVSGSHDGSGSVCVVLTSVRVVCQNTLAMALRTGTHIWRFKHTSNAKKRLEQVRQALKQERATSDQWNAWANKLAGTKVSPDYVKAFYKALLTPPKDANAKEDLSTQRLNSWDELLGLFCGKQEGALNPALKGTAWGALNAVTQWADHSRTIRAAAGRSPEEARLDSVWFGSANHVKNQAAALLEETLGFADADSPLDLLTTREATTQEKVRVAMGGSSILDGIEVASPQKRLARKAAVTSKN